MKSLEKIQQKDKALLLLVFLLLFFSSCSAVNNGRSADILEYLNVLGSTLEETEEAYPLSDRNSIEEGKVQGIRNEDLLVALGYSEEEAAQAGRILENQSVLLEETTSVEGKEALVFLGYDPSLDRVHALYAGLLLKEPTEKDYEYLQTLSEQLGKRYQQVASTTPNKIQKKSFDAVKDYSASFAYETDLSLEEYAPGRFPQIDGEGSGQYKENFTLILKIQELADRDVYVQLMFYPKPVL